MDHLAIIGHLLDDLTDAPEDLQSSRSNSAVAILRSQLYKQPGIALDKLIEMRYSNSRTLAAFSKIFQEHVSAALKSAETLGIPDIVEYVRSYRVFVDSLPVYLHSQHLKQILPEFIEVEL